jgi:predicted DCC family thiol-disulfide oxidoreductase YuxK
MKEFENWLESYKNVENLNNIGFKIFLFISILFLLPLKSFEGMALIPDYLYSPNIGNISYYLFDSIPPALFFKTIGNVNIILFFLLFFGKRNFLIGLLLCFNLTICYSLRNSFGKIDHNYLNIIILPIIGYVFDERVKGNKNWIYPLFLFLFAFSFISAGIPKLLDARYLGGDFQMFKDQVINHGNVQLVNEIESFFGDKVYYLWEFLDFSAVLFEVFFPLIIFLRIKNIPIFICFASIFHIANYYCFNIFFEGMVYGYLFLIGSLLFDKKWDESLFKMKYTKFIFNSVMLLLCIYMIYDQSYFYHKDLIYSSRPWFYVALILATVGTYFHEKRKTLKRERVTEAFNNKSIVFYDGDCGFCNSTISFVLKKEKKKEILFCSLQSAFAKKTFDEFDVKINLDTIFYLTDNRLLTKSSAIFEISKDLVFPYSIARYVSYVCPKIIADFGYSIVAKYRHKIMPLEQACEIPDEEDRNRFIF